MYQVFQEVRDDFDNAMMLRSGRLVRGLGKALEVAERKSFKAMTEIRDMHNVVVEVFRKGVPLRGMRHE